MARLKFKIYSLGCKVNQYDGGELGGLLKSAGFVSARNNADVAIVNSCAVTAGAVTKNREMVKKARRENPRAKIILTGCWPRADYQKINKKILGADLIWKKENFSGLIEKLKKYTKYQIQNTKYKKGASNIFDLTSVNNNQNRSRYFLKIQDGCEQFCSYCIVPFVRGKLQSRPMTEIIAEAEAAVKNGYREIVLCGIHLGLFGKNNLHKKQEEKQANLGNLLRKLVKIKRLARIRLSSIEITEVGDDLIKFIASERKICRHLHIPLQSGCDKILRAMKRPYDTKFFAARMKKIRKKIPDIAISTDVIAGFPGETTKDFLVTENFIKKIKFSRLHVFSFSPREGTAAFNFPCRVGEREIKTRSEILRTLSDELAAAYQKKFAGKILTLAVEQNRSSWTGKKRGEKMKGKSEYFFDVLFTPADIREPKARHKNFIGQLVRVKIPVDKTIKKL